MKNTGGKIVKAVITSIVAAGLGVAFTKGVDKYNGATDKIQQDHNAVVEQIREVRSMVEEVNNKANITNDKVDNLIDSVNNGKSNFLPDLDLYNQLKDYFDSIPISQVCNIVDISIFIMVIIVIVEIIAILFGNELIKYYDLENKYPKLGIFFKTRARLQKYVLMWNFFTIFAFCLAGILFNVLMFIAA